MSVSGDAGSSRGGESASASAATNTFTPNSAMATVPPKPEATAQGQAPVPQSMGSTPSQHHPNPAYPDSADQGFADVSHGISLPSNSATTRGTAAGGPASVADSPYRFMAPNIGALSAVVAVTFERVCMLLDLGLIVLSGACTVCYTFWRKKRIS